MIFSVILNKMTKLAIEINAGCLDCLSSENESVSGEQLCGGELGGSGFLLHGGQSALPAHGRIRSQQHRVPTGTSLNLNTLLANYP